MKKPRRDIVNPKTETYMRNIPSKFATLMPAALLALLSALNSQLSTLFAQGTAFTYQGRLAAGANTANGNYDMQFSLRDALTPPGNPVGPTNTITPVAVSNGLFTVALDFGANFPGADRWLEIGVRTNGAANYTTLSPRQKLTPTPYAMTASNLSGTLPASQLTGTLPSALLGGTYSGTLTLNNAADSFTGNGAGLTSLKANNLSSGTVADARLSANAALLNRSPQTFTGQNTFNNSVGIGTASPAAPLHVQQGSGSGLTPGSAAIVGDSQTSTYGIWGASANTGVYGFGRNYGVYGYGTTGVYGFGNAGYGGYFASDSTGLYASGSPAIVAVGNVGIGTASPSVPLHVKEGSGSGVTPGSAAIVGDAQGKVSGIWGASGVANGIGVVGECDNGTSPYGVWGRSSSGYGVYGTGGNAGVLGSGGTYGGYFSSSGGTGLYGSSTAANGNGVVGECNSGTSAYGVYGKSTSGYGVYGQGGVAGVYGSSGSYGGIFDGTLGTGLLVFGSPAIRTSGSVGINANPAATLHVEGNTATTGNNTADFADPSIGPNHSHIHYGSLGDWYIRSAHDGGRVIMQDQSASAYVGIGTGTPAYKLDVNGIIRGNNVSPSDARWKKNIAPLTNALDTIERLRGVRYDWRAEEFPKINFEPGPQIGLIAQEVKEILPEAVSQDREGFYSVAYSKLIPVLVEGMKEQQDQLRAKDARVAALEKANDEMHLELTVQKELTSRMQAEFVTMQKVVARLADKSAAKFVLNQEPTEEK
jgi:hypothetical protein